MERRLKTKSNIGIYAPQPQLFRWSVHVAECKWIFYGFRSLTGKSMLLHGLPIVVINHCQNREHEDIHGSLSELYVELVPVASDPETDSWSDCEEDVVDWMGRGGDSKYLNPPPPSLLPLAPPAPPLPNPQPHSPHPGAPHERNRLPPALML